MLLARRARADAIADATADATVVRADVIRRYLLVFL
jgi:hypothetical protein